MEKQEVLIKLKSLSNKKDKKGMICFGIQGNVWGVPMPKIRGLAKDIGKKHFLAKELVKSKIHEAIILASLVAEIDKLTLKQMDSWICYFESWDTCDQMAMNLFRYHKGAVSRCFKWAKRKNEFEKRMAFSLIAALAASKKIELENVVFEDFFEIIKKSSFDERNFVKKAVNWALRQIGKRNEILRKKAIKVAKEIKKFDSKTAKWIANNALSELTKMG